MSSTQSQTQWLALSHWALMAVSGPQALPFLQGQVTCDLRDLAPDVTRPGAHCTPKGRMVFSFRALATGDERFLLRLPVSMVESARATLGKYIVFSKAELSALGEEWVLRGMSGPEASALLAEHLTQPASEQDHWVEHEGQILLTLAPDRFECWLKRETAERLDQALAGYRSEGGDNVWTLLDIRAGQGEVTPETRELFTPQALNFPAVGAVSFRKGCYTGQEVVARLHYRGKLKRHMRRLGLDWGKEQPLPRPGQPLTNAEERKVGELVLAARSGDEQIECLAVLDDSALDSARLPGSTAPARLLPLPYSVE